MTTVNVALDAFLLAGEADGLRAKTLVWYRAILKPLQTEFGAAALDTITPEQMRKFVIRLRHDARSEVTAADRITALHRFWSWSAGEYAVATPMARIRRPNRPDPAPKSPTIEHVKTLIAAIPSTREGARNLALLIVVLDSCLRIDEALALTPEDIDFAAHQITIRHGKGGKRRVVPFTCECEAVLVRWLARRPLAAEYVFVALAGAGNERLTYWGAREALRRMHKAAGLEIFFGWHSYRHFGARQYRLGGGDPLNLQRLLGHADIATTFKHYGNWLEVELIEQHELHSPLNSLHEQKGI